VAVVCDSRIKTSGKFILGFWCGALLVLEDHNVMVVKSVADNVEVSLYSNLISLVTVEILEVYTSE
jgi:hypothetical protein